MKINVSIPTDVPAASPRVMVETIVMKLKKVPAVGDFVFVNDEHYRIVSVSHDESGIFVQGLPAPLPDILNLYLMSQRPAYTHEGSLEPLGMGN